LAGRAKAEGTPETRKILIAFLAPAKPGNRERARELGAAAYLALPFNPTELGSVIRDLLNGVVRDDWAEPRREETGRSRSPVKTAPTPKAPPKRETTRRVRTFIIGANLLLAVVLGAAVIWLGYAWLDTWWTLIVTIPVAFAIFGSWSRWKETSWAREVRSQR
jgi:CheY-like chemotaxis protein